MRFITAVRSGSVSAFVGAGLVIGLGACAAHAPGVTPTLSSAPAPVTAAEPMPAPVDVAPPAVPAAEPTTRTDAQRARDAELMPKAGALVDAFVNRDAQLSRDRKKVLFRSNRDGVWQAYVADATKPAAPATRLAPSRERVAFARFSADEKSIVFTRDEGGDESFRIFRMSPDGSAITNLTPGEALDRDEPQLPRLRPTQMVYSARDKSHAATTVYVQSLGGGEARKAYVDPRPAEVVDVSPDGNHALLVEVRSPSDAVLFRVDLDEGKAVRIFPQSERKIARITAARYSSDGARVYVASDDGTESSFVIRIEPSSGVISGRYREESPPTARIASIDVSPVEDRLAVVVDAGDRTELRLLDGALRPVATVKTPPGEIETGTFTRDGKSLTAMVGAPDRPTDVLEVDAATGVTKALRSEARASLAAVLGTATAPRIVVSQERIPSFDGLAIPTNVYLPSPAVAKRERLGTVVMVHGGPAASAHVRWNPMTAFLTSQGYAVVEPNVRGSTGFGRAFELADDREKRADALRDLEAVNTWVRGKEWADRDRVVVMGSGFGGYMTLLALSRQPTLWRAGVDLEGIADLKAFLRSTTATVRAALADEIGDLDEQPALLTALSPMAQVDAIKSPLFVYHGRNDARVSRSESDAIVLALRARHVPVEYMLADGEGHGLEQRDTKVELMARVARFLDENAPRSTAPLNVALR